jgi:hypothetical protein
MSHEYVDDECFICTHYTRFLSDSHTWTCECCHLVEIGIDDPANPTNNIIWGRYQLRCGHQTHLRCLRKWCKEVGYVGCPSCGPILEIDANQFCNQCEQFGHTTQSCKK